MWAKVIRFMPLIVSPLNPAQSEGMILVFGRHPALRSYLNCAFLFK
jgi:hypothetical protein